MCFDPSQNDDAIGFVSEFIQVCDGSVFRRSQFDGFHRRFDVRADGPMVEARALSGGNQQKFVLGRELSDAPAALVVENPSRGLDFKATASVQTALRDARDAFEKAYFEFHLAKEGGSMTRVAEKTGLERTHLYRKLKQLGVDLSRNRRGSALVL